MLIYKTKLGAKKCLVNCKITFHLDSETSRTAGKWSVMGMRIPHSLLFHDLLRNEFEIQYKQLSFSAIEYKLQRQVNNIPELNVELSFLY